MAHMFQSPDVPTDVADIIGRAHWRSARSTEDVAPHQYNVLGWERDDLTASEFRLVAATIKKLGRLEEWTPPEEWVRRWGGKPMRNRYLYVGEYAYWYTHPRDSAPMLNREHVSVQRGTPTRRVIALTEQMF
jgi:hypothetical protein